MSYFGVTVVCLSLFYFTEQVGDPGENHRSALQQQETEVWKLALQCCECYLWTYPTILLFFFLFAYCNKNTQSTVVAVWSVQFSEEAEVFQVWRVKSWWVFPLKMSFLSLCENEQFIIYPAWCFLALLFVGDSTGVNGLNVECQQPGEYSGDSKCLFFIDDRKSAKQKMYLV